MQVQEVTVPAEVMHAEAGKRWRDIGIDPRTVAYESDLRIITSRGPEGAAVSYEAIANLDSDAVEAMVAGVPVSYPA